MVCGAGDESRPRYSLPEVRIHAKGPLPQVPSADAMVQEADGVWRVRLATGGEPAALLSALVSAGVRIDRFEPTLAPMEDIFLRVVREGRA